MTDFYGTFESNRKIQKYRELIVGEHSNESYKKQSQSKNAISQKKLIKGQ